MLALEELPPSIQKLIRMVIQRLDPDQIILFGSRARGDHRETSDYDLAIKAAKLSKDVWNRVKLDIEEEPFTLYKVDLVHFEEMDAQYQARISAEGKKLYER